MQDFKKFVDDKNKQQTTAQPNGNDMEFIKNIASKYDGQSEDKLLEDIFSNVVSEKAKGKLKNEDIIRLAKTVSPMLSAKQRAKLNELVERLIKL